MKAFSKWSERNSNPQIAPSQLAENAWKAALEWAKSRAEAYGESAPARYVLGDIDEELEGE